jgi:uncharacterized protein
MQELHRDVPAPPGWGLDLVAIPAGTAISLDLRLESVMDGVLVTADLNAPVEGECGRCLDPITTAVVTDFVELFTYEADPDDEDSLTLDGDLIDLAPVVRDAIVLSLPLNPLCDPDCEGLCSECGARLAEVGPDHSHESLDPRWSALAGLSPSGPGEGRDPGSEPSAPDPGHTGSATPSRSGLRAERDELIEEN